MREPMTDTRLREAREVAWNPVYRPSADFPEHVYRHDLFRDAVSEVERLRGTAGVWRPTAVVLHEILAEHRVMMQLANRNQVEPPKLVRDLMQWAATTVECETHGQRERAEQSEAETARLRAQLAEATALLSHFVDHEDQPCRLDHHGACKEHGGSSLRPCDVAVGRELLARIQNGNGGPGCLCPHTYQPDGRLVRDGVLALGCPVHDPDAKENGNG